MIEFVVIQNNIIQENVWKNASREGKMQEEGRCEKIARRPREHAYVVNRDVSRWIHPLRLNLASIPQICLILFGFLFACDHRRSTSTYFALHLSYVLSTRHRFSDTRIFSIKKKKKNCASNSCETRCKMKSYRIRMVKLRCSCRHTYIQTVMS